MTDRKTYELLELAMRGADWSVVNHFIPDELRDREGLEFRRAQILVFFTLSMFVAFFPPYAVLYGWVLDIPSAFYLVWVQCIPPVVGLPLFKRTGRLDWLTHLICISSTILYGGYGILMDGLAGPAPMWMLSVSVVALVFAGLRSGMLWTGVSFSVFVGLYGAKSVGWLPSSVLSASHVLLVRFVSIMGLGICLFLLFLFQRGLTQRLLVQLQEARDELEERALHDPLTGLPNRSLLTHRLSEALEQARQHGAALGVALIDLDNFKSINDSLGHSVGDDILSRVARRLETSIRRRDTVARIGGDEYMCLFENLEDEGHLERLEEDILECFRKPFDVTSAHPLHISASIGLTRLERRDLEGAEAEHVIDNLTRTADRAMYEAKETPGIASMHFENPLDDDAPSTIELEHRLREGLEDNKVTPYLQPIYQLERGDPMAFEVLMRWEGPFEGNQEYSTGALIASAERSGLINSLGRHMMSEVCRLTRRFRHRAKVDIEPTFWINLSPCQLEREESILELLDTLQSRAPERVSFQFEVTETALLERAEGLTCLQDEGYGVVLDDFGTGHSSLLRLKEMPVEAIKIDTTFIHGLGTDTTDRAIIGNVLDLGERLDMSVVAEGVEQPEQLEQLRELGCTAAQGFELAYPRPFEETLERSQNDSSPFDRRSAE